MNERRIGKCPKCGGEMQPGSVHGDFRILKVGDLYGDKANVFYCRNCGFVELYKGPSTKESWRWSRQEQAPVSEEPQKPKEEEAERKVVKKLVR